MVFDFNRLTICQMPSGPLDDRARRLSSDPVSIPTPFPTYPAFIGALEILIINFDLSLRTKNLLSDGLSH